MRLYISGPITGDKNYRRKFRGAADELTARGYEVINPAELTGVIGKSFTYKEIIALDLDLLAKCDALIQLPRWEKSRGANIEYGFALASDKLVISLEDLLEGGDTHGK